MITFRCCRIDYFSIFCSKTCRSISLCPQNTASVWVLRNFASSIFRKFADIAFSLWQIFVDILLPRKFASSIFRCPQRNFAQSYEFSPASAKFQMSNVRNFKQKFAEFSRNFNENKAQISSKFALITFAQYCRLK